VIIGPIGLGMAFRAAHLAVHFLLNLSSSSEPEVQMIVGCMHERQRFVLVRVWLRLAVVPVLMPTRPPG
jgi:hypothetical protein